MIERIVLTSAVVLLAACEKTTGPEPMDGEMATATVIGHVLGPNGQGVAGANVVVEARTLNSCANAEMDRDSVTTDRQGAFHATVRNWGTGYTVCARVRVIANAAFTPDTVDRPSVRMHYQTPDTVRLVITLQDR